MLIICSKVNSVLPIVLESYPFYFKIELSCTMVNIEDRSTINKTYLFPSDHAIKISLTKHISDLNNTIALWINNSFTTDDSVPDTKHRIHKFIAFRPKMAKSQQEISILTNVIKSLQIMYNLKLYESNSSPICLHLDQVKNHYMLLRTLVVYAETVICDKCKKSSTTQYKQTFGTELVRPLFWAYDFECRNFVDHLNNIHDELIKILKKHFWTFHNKQMAIIPPFTMMAYICSLHNQMGCHLIARAMTTVLGILKYSLNRGITHSNTHSCLECLGYVSCLYRKVLVLTAAVGDLESQSLLNGSVSDGRQVRVLAGHTKAYKCFAENLHTDHRKQAFSLIPPRNFRQCPKLGRAFLHKLGKLCTDWLREEEKGERRIQGSHVPSLWCWYYGQSCCGGMNGAHFRDKQWIQVERQTNSATYTKSAVTQETPYGSLYHEARNSARNWLVLFEFHVGDHWDVKFYQSLHS
ncbi:hypothetical protein PROFUN_15127 [Planoprotostelium fungivorum]|uniref:Uncharacterized protein n=1 Tax=Planoprotostelium fungivorum TaxID=1890364 RepID=A0A2P6MZX6_9EUKA|nr:hypothetical protein PROFUN_15127 [Planoprotostelium fungivorum]